MTEINNTLFSLSSFSEAFIIFSLVVLDSIMASNSLNRSQRKRTTTKFFSPSDSDRYALVFFYLSDQYKIVKYGDIIGNKDDEVQLRNGDIGLLIMMGRLLIVKIVAK